MNLELLKQKPFFLSSTQIEEIRMQISTMTTHEKIGQLICEILWDKPGYDPLSVMEYIKPGAVMYRPFKAARMREFSTLLQGKSEIPLLVACNLERGGSGGNGGMEDGTYIASPMGVAATDEEETAYKLGEVCAAEGASVGINWTFEPIIDIDINPENPITNVRTYGSDCDRIIKMARNYSKACREHGMATTIKHFPGDGVDYRDQHLLSSVNSLSSDQWFETYGKVYKALIDDGALTLMSAHIMQPALTRLVNPQIRDEDILPGSLSKELMQGILRERMHFNGLICSDATQMVGFTSSMERRKAIPLAIEHGVDMLIFTLNQKEDVEALEEGLRTGLLTESRLNAACARILALKQHLGLFRRQKEKTLIPEENAMDVIGCKRHQGWAVECADKAITLVKNKENILPLDSRKLKKVTLIQATNEKPVGGYLGEAKLFKTLLEKEGFLVRWFEDVPHPGPKYSIGELKDDTDLFIYYANFKVSSNQTTIRIVWSDFLGDSSPKYVHDVPTLFISFSNPYHLVDVPMVKTYINAYTSNEPTVRMVVEKLMGRSEFKGTSPVDPYANLWDARL